MNTPIERLKELVSKYPSQAQAARGLGIDPSVLSLVLTGRREMSARIVAKLGFRRVVTYELLPGPAGADRPLLITQGEEDVQEN